jgi:hypothetical protein
VDDDVPADDELRQLSREFTDELYDGYRYLAKVINYRAKQFLEMVTMHGGVGTAQILLRGRDASDGFTRLWQEKMLGHSLEVTVLRPKYQRLFTDHERRIARNRLEAHGFNVEQYVALHSN